MRPGTSPVGRAHLVVGVGPASTAEARGFDVQGSRQGNPSAIARAIGQTVEAAAWTALAGDAERGRRPREIEDLPGHRGGDDLGRAGRRDDLVVAAERDDRLQEADALGGLDVQLGLVDEHDRVLVPGPLERQREEHALLLARAQLFEVEHGPVAPREAKAVALALRLDAVERLAEQEGTERRPDLLPRLEAPRESDAVRSHPVGEGEAVRVDGGDHVESGSGRRYTGTLTSGTGLLAVDRVDADGRGP